MEEKESNLKQVRVRRSNLAIERDVLNAVSSLVKEVGFSKITLLLISQKANVEISVINRHFGTLEQLLERYTQKYDFWLNDILDKNLESILSEENSLESVVEQFVSALWNNKEMQQLMIWELMEDNAITRRSAKRREISIENILPHYEAFLGKINGNCDPKAILAILVSGMYFLVLRRKRSSFCGIDFSTKQGRKELISALSYMMSVLGEKTP